MKPTPTSHDNFILSHSSLKATKEDKTEVLSFAILDKGFGSWEVYKIGGRFESEVAFLADSSGRIIANPVESLEEREEADETGSIRQQG
jgi:hypothetical protein